MWKSCIYVQTENNNNNKQSNVPIYVSIYKRIYICINAQQTERFAIWCVYIVFLLFIAV